MTSFKTAWVICGLAPNEGLNRYDGYRFTSFFPDRNNAHALSHKWIDVLLADRAGSVWVGTRGGGLNRLDPATSRFQVFRHDPGDPGSLSHDRVRALYEDSADTLWVGTEGGLNRFDPVSRAFVRLRHDPSDPTSISNDQIRSISEDRAGFLWIGTSGGGLNRFDPKTGAFVRYRQDPGDPTSLSDDRVSSVYVDRDDRVWVGTYHGGLNRLDRDRQGFVRFRHRPADPGSLATNSVLRIFQDQNGVMWVGTEDGLNEWQPATDSFVRYQRNPANPLSLSDNRVLSLYQDRGGVLWVGTYNGLNKWNALTGAIDYYTHVPDEPATLSAAIVTSFAEDGREGLWVGTYDGGLNRFDRSSGTFHHYRHDPRDPHTLSDDRVMSLLVDRAGVLWVGTLNGGLNRLEPDRKSFTRYRHDPADPDSLSSDGVTTIFEDSRGALWVGTFGGGLNLFDRVQKTFTRYRHDVTDTESLSSDRVLTVQEDAKGELWIGTSGGGVNRFRRDTQTFTRYRHDPADPNSLSSDAAWVIHLGASGTLWIGTDSGVNRWDGTDSERGLGRFTRFPLTERGLPSVTVQGILSDTAGHLWISSNRGLYRLEPHTGHVKHLGAEQGLQSDDFSQGAYCRSADGTLFFGGVNGFNAFDPASMRDNTHPPPVVLTSFIKANKRVKSAEALSQLEKIDLTHRDYAIAFEFVALDFTAPEKNQFRYRLVGFDPNWVDNGTLRRATYTHLPPGQYEFQVQAANNDGIWNERGVSIDLHVQPPPWRTVWAYTMYILIIIGTAGGYVYSQKKRSAWEAAQRHRLEMEVQRRTEQLAQRNQDLDSLNRQFKEASVTDALTGLKNRRYLDEFIGSEIALLHRTMEEKSQEDPQTLDASYSLLSMMIDLDGFKRINDMHGHHAGDLALLQVRDILQDCCRQSDTIIRWGGDEFMIIGHCANRTAAEKLAERIRIALAAHAYQLMKGQTGRLSGSIGFALYPFLRDNPRLFTWENVAAVADQAAYIAKENQRNAWVGIYGSCSHSYSDLYHRIKTDLENLANQKVIAINTSIEGSIETY